MPGCPIIRPTKHKTKRSLSGILHHQLRAWNTQNADPARLHLNQVLAGTTDAKDMAQKIMDRVALKVMRKDAVRAVELFLGASDEYWENGGKPEPLFARFKDFLHQEYGADNVVAMGVHMDENKPHAWAIITPITPDGRLSAAHWFDGPKKLEALNDRIGAYMAPLGMVRARRGVKATHIDMKTMHQAALGSPGAQKRIDREFRRRAEQSEKRAKEAAEEEAEAKRRAEVAKSGIERFKAFVRGQREALASEWRRIRQLDESLSPIERERAARRLADLAEQQKKKEATIQETRAKPVGPTNTRSLGPELP
jgi:hypothetical protein